MAKTRIVKEGSTLSIIAIIYYLLNRKKLKNEKCLARIWLKREESGVRNIIASIDSILQNARVDRNDERVASSNPLFILEKGDYVHMNMCMFHEYWLFDGEKLIYDKEMSC
jgi:hypothetical protein